MRDERWMDDRGRDRQTDSETHRGRERLTDGQKGEYVGAIIQLAAIGHPNRLSINCTNQIMVSTSYHSVDNVSIPCDLLHVRHCVCVRVCFKTG